MLGYRPVFLYLLPKPQKCPRKCVPHFPIAQKWKLSKVKTKIPNEKSYQKAKKKHLCEKTSSSEVI